MTAGGLLVIVITICIGAVSYTHLDVYKRQAQAQMITRDQKQLIEVTIKGDAQWEKNYVYYDGDKERETETEDAEHTLYYIDDGGTWKLYDLDLWTW